ncbi:pseudouridine synthase [Podospora conica]|nr:pseudouridine synthase [Schizothecium conicum]
MTAAALRLPRRHFGVTASIAYSLTLPPLVASSPVHRPLQPRRLLQTRTMADDYAQWTKESLVKHIRHLEAQFRHQQNLLQQQLPNEQTPASAVTTTTTTTPTTAQQPPSSEPITTSSETTTEPPKKKVRTFDPSKYSSRLVALKLAYLGKNYNGFEYQPFGSQSTIEEELWKALVKSFLIFPEQPERVDFNAKALEYSKCGRTDRGVSAFGQVIAIRLRSNAPSAGQEAGAWDPRRDEIEYCRALNRMLPADIRILAWAPAEDGFSARFSCRERQYRYFFTQPAYTPTPSETGAKDGWLDIEAMRDAAKRFEGLHDFRNFCKIDRTKQITNFMRRVYEADVVEVKDASTALAYLDHANLRGGVAGEGTLPKVYYFHVRGSAFLWHQIRHMVAILFLVGQGLEPASVVDELMDVEKNPCKPSYTMADDVPLVLWDCIFPRGVEADLGVAPVDVTADGIVLGNAHDPAADVDTNMQDAIEWEWVGQKGAHNHDLTGQLWQYWREKKIDELLAGQLLGCVSAKTEPGRVFAGAEVRKTKGGALSQRIFEGGNSGRSHGRYIPVMKRPVQMSAANANDKWAQSKGFASAAEMTSIKNWRTVIKESKAASKADGGEPKAGRRKSSVDADSAAVVE